MEAQQNPLVAADHIGTVFKGFLTQLNMNIYLGRHE